VDITAHVGLGAGGEDSGIQMRRLVWCVKDATIKILLVDTVLGIKNLEQ
jgi:hypothetical protein